MLRLIRIREFALIRELQVEFAPGLNLLTGETGSGKSILADALGLIVGARASQEMVRSGGEPAVLEGIFSMQGESPVRRMLAEAGIEAEDDQVLVRREVSPSGRNRIFVNNSLVTLSFLKSIGEHLADIHGQQDQQSLLNLKSHLGFLDRFGGNDPTVRELRESYQRLQEIQKQIDSMEMDEQERLKRVDILRYQVDEIRRANLRPDEREELENEKIILSNREEIFASAGELYNLLYEGEGSVLSQAKRAFRILQQLENFDSAWREHRELLADSLYKLEDLAYFTRDYKERIDFAPDRLEQAEQRLSELERLAQKYGHSVTETLKYADKCEAELQDLVSHRERLALFEEQFETELKQYQSLAERLSAKRHRDARQLEREIRKELRALSMENAEFSVCFHTQQAESGSRRIPGHFTDSGIDRVEFMVSANKGEELKPLARIASGGEISRIMLSLKAICGTEEPGKTLVFDEIDAGIGGRVAEAVGRRLRDISSSQQVLCVTHLPQIAAFASSHYRVTKATAGSRTETSVQRLDQSERIEELARMLGGRTITETTRNHAREMLRSCEIRAS
jgi:DNA repair protein RecN (Recombination protein N)